MEEKFDAEFKKKVKGINPEVPDIVKLRINDTLASLSAKRSWRKYGYLSAAAALFLICLVGIRYIYPMKLTGEKNSSAAGSMAIVANDASGEKNKEAVISGYSAGDKNEVKKDAYDQVGGNTAVNTEKSTPKSTTSKPTGTVEPRCGIAANSGDMKITTTPKDGDTAEDKGIQLVLKTAKYDGKEIRVEFDKSSSSSNKATAAKQVQENTITANSAPKRLMQSAGIDVAKQYDIRVVVNGIPLKCSINVIETPQGENKYSSTMIIVPDSGLPENFDMILNFDKIGEVSGQWLLSAHVLKQ